MTLPRAMASAKPPQFSAGAAVEARSDSPLSSGPPREDATRLAGTSILMIKLGDNPASLWMTLAAHRTGCASAIPRLSLRHFRALLNANAKGLDLLWGEQDDVQWMRQVYFGKSLRLSDRLAEHAGTDDWWLEAQVMTRLPKGLSAGGAHLERDFILADRSIAEVILTNRKVPEPPSVDDSAREDIDFLRATAARLLLPLGPKAYRFVRALRRPGRATESA